MRRLCLIFFLFSLTVVAVDIKKLPEEEQSLASTVDPWGLAFSDQLARFTSYFESYPEAEFLAGVTHNLVKLWPNKYWFRGMVLGPGKVHQTARLWAVPDSTVSFQVVILPRTGAQQARYRVVATAGVPVSIFREIFVTLDNPPYPRFQSQQWPDPLLLENSCELSGTQAGVFLIELKIPTGETRQRLTCDIRVSGDRGQPVRFSVPVEVVKLRIQPKDFPLVAWFSRERLSEVQFQEMCSLALEHHLQVFCQEYLASLWVEPQKFEQFIRFLMSKGQRYFQIHRVDQALYDFLKERNWLSYFLVYSNVDEPSEETFVNKNIPFAENFRRQFPGLRIFLASEYHPQMEKGCDIWLTDLSSSRYDPSNFELPEKPLLWHYYCHLPINFQMRAPLVQAPNMLIDNPALEHRITLWMSWYFRAKGVFIWAGNREWNTLKDFWQTGSLNVQPYKYPYGGIHHGNGFLVYPPVTPEGQVLPSLRLKILRDGMEDIAILTAIEKNYARQFKNTLSPVPDVFVHPHYYDHLPEKLLQHRDYLLAQLRKLGL